MLSGGGARGMAHIGVLKVLEELRVPIDAIAGTSMGAIVGGLHASGMSASEIEEVMSSIDWQDAFRDRTARSKLAFRRKQDDQNFLVRLPLGFKGGKFLLPRGLIQGQKLNQMLRSLTAPVTLVEDFDELPIPFRAVATDLESGQPVVLDSGDLATAMRASMSAPAVFSPVEFENRLLVDGGIVENLPIEVARQMGVDLLIVVDVSFPLLPRSQLTSALEVSNQMLAIFVRRDAERQRATLTERDIVIDPPLGDITSVHFHRVRQAIAAGVKAAQDMAPQLATLALPPDEYSQHLAARLRNRDGEPVHIAFIRTDELSKPYERTIEAALKPLVDQPFEPRELEDAIELLYGLDTFETLDYRLLREDNRQGLEVRARRKSWGPNYVRFGLNLQDDFEGNNSFNAAARFIVTEINALGAEWVTDLQVGENPRFSTEFYQPLTYAARYFVAPRLDFEIRNVPVLDQQERIAEYRLRSGQFGLDVGREFGNWGELRMGVRRGYGNARLRIGEPTLPEDEYDLGEYFVRFAYDKLDNFNFPREGQVFALQWNAARTELGDDNNADLLSMDWLLARTIGRHTLLGWVSTGTTLDSGDAAVTDFFTLGGFFDLSGLRPNSLSGPHFGIARLLYYKQIGREGPGFLDVPVYAGVSFEVGNVWQQRNDASFSSAFKDGSVFLGLDTLIGPLYFGAGFDDGGDTAFYLFLGRPF